MMRRKATTISLLALITLVGCASQEAPPPPEQEAAAEFEIVAELNEGPGNITVTPAGTILVSLHQFFGHETRVASIDEQGGLEAFGEDAGINSVLGLQADANDVVWLLDNAMRGDETRQLVGWHALEDRLVQKIDLMPVTTEGSFLNDLAVDPERGVAYIADPAGGPDAAIIIVDLQSGSARRVLEGHASVVPEDVDLVIDGSPLVVRREDGSEVRPRVGINPIALDSSGMWLYYGPMHGLSMYRVRTADLRDDNLAPQDLAARVERWADKPICDGISIDDAGNLYLGDLEQNAIGVIDASGEYRVLVSDPQLSWVDAFSFGPDGHLYSVANQLHRSAVLNGGKSAIELPFLVIRMEPLAGGVTGR